MSNRKGKGAAVGEEGAAAAGPSTAAVPGGGITGTIKRKRGLFTRDLRPMLFGFGDVANPLPETVELVEELVTDYVTDLMHKALEGSAAQRGRLAHQDIVFLVRKDERKYNRCLELLEMNEELKRARKNFDFDESQAKEENA
mmetsp:Transcript_19076/g.36456  ORF Transcript_19076/g.36456 Transcript_19076/m.36456 type:complete len:142 (+) Transcript_19076:734-1159(+)|eukprot:CAMPEP_0114235180 /NCGR_PEP_ID=MMETSP0058-20121206/6108_1 /TAXON_ID=36894 /ORGANISM="Pyramimonas parkeae, CCMP726" /LENGTH=141 /DNA_ID=CAMNT_0001346915 /DNA_START=689 /DNA_END=1114 /DNA_ORIENTATION=-